MLGPMPSKGKRKKGGSASGGESPSQTNSEKQKKKQAKIDTTQPKLDSFLEMETGAGVGIPSPEKAKSTNDNPIFIAILDMQKTMERMFTKIEVLLAEKVEINATNIRDLQTGSDFNGNIVETLQKDNDSLKLRCDMYEGRIIRLEKQLAATNEKVLDLTSRSMRNNLLFEGLPEVKDEKSEQTEGIVRDFVFDELKIQESDMGKIQFDGIHRTGPKGTKPRTIVARFNPRKGKDLVLRNTKNLDPKYKINEQFPPEIAERRKALLPLRREMKLKGHRVNISYDKLIVNGKQYYPPTATPGVTHADAKLDDDTRKKIKITHSGQTTTEGSVFQGHVSKIKDPELIEPALFKLYENISIAQATHNIWAFRGTLNGKLFENHKDDGEHSASFKMLELMRLKNIENCLVIVSRWKGGGDLGPTRFECIKEAATRALRQACLIA